MAETPQSRPGRPLEVIAALFAGLLVVSNIASARLIAAGPLSFDAGTLVFPLTYIIGDVLTEVYGYARSRRIIWAAFFTLLMSFLILWLVSLFPSPEGWGGGGAWGEVMGVAPRIALASLLAFLGGEFLNAAVLSRLKARSPKRGPALRFAASTLAGQALDTALFASVAFLGVLPPPLFFALVLSNYAYKCGFEFVLLPLTLFAARRLKAAEGLDRVDRGVSLNPFSLSLDDDSEEAGGK
jgi:uncharacterized integral membrane protein (TIGR00697 family)